MLTAADTAYSMAFMRALEKERPASERLFEDPYAALFSAGGAHASEEASRFLQSPFFVDAVRVRTRFIDDFLREGLASGVCQVVLLGAGFDTRGLRLPGDRGVPGQRLRGRLRRADGEEARAPRRRRRQVACADRGCGVRLHGARV
jgi:hypothetical protein